MKTYVLARGKGCQAPNELSLKDAASSSPFLESGRGKAPSGSSHGSFQPLITDVIKQNPIEKSHTDLPLRTGSCWPGQPRATPVPPMETPNGFLLEKTLGVHLSVWAVASPFGCQSDSRMGSKASGMLPAPWEPGKLQIHLAFPAGPLAWHRPLGDPPLPYFCSFLVEARMDALVCATAGSW